MPVHENIASLFAPKTIAIVGASQHSGKIGNILVSNLLRGGFQGKIFPVHPEADSILGLPALRKLADIPAQYRPLDLAVFCVPAKQTLELLPELAALPARAAIILSAGFKETGSNGAHLERELKRLATEQRLTLLGPHCLGLLNSAAKLNASFAHAAPLPGGIGFFSQSGALCTAIFDWARARHFGFSSFVSLGNKALLDESDMLAYMAEDDQTKVIVGYLESVENGARFLRNAHLATRKKPVILLRAGRTPAGARASSSRTGVLTGADLAYEAAFRQTGIIRARQMEDLFGMAQAFASQPLPKGPGLAIVTNAGGPGVAATDACDEAGLSLTRLSQSTLAALQDYLPPYASLYNPVDVLSDAPADRIVTAAGSVLLDPGVHSLLVLASPTPYVPLDSIADDIAALPNPDNKPIFACLMGGESVHAAWRRFAERRIPCYPFPEAAINAIAAMYRQSLWKENPLPVEVGYRHDRGRARAALETARSKGLLDLPQPLVREILRAYEMPLLEAKLARTSDEAVQIARQTGGPVALKIASPHIPHKTEIRGVLLNLDTPDKVRSAFTAITGRASRLHKEAYISGCMVQAMAPEHSREVIIGFKRDERFGPLVTFGLGGIHVEAFKDISCRLAPLSLDDVHDMVREIRAFPLLAGMRGERPVQFTALEDLLLIVSQLALDFPEIQEAECNPVLAHPDGALVADMRVLLSPAEERHK